MEWDSGAQPPLPGFLCTVQQRPQRGRNTWNGRVRATCHVPYLALHGAQPEGP